MVKPASNRSKASKSVQKRTNVQNQVAQRIFELRNSGMGFRRISNRLEKEGLATISKSTVANILAQAQTQSKVSAKNLPGDPVLRVLAEREVELLKQVDKIQARGQARQRNRDLQLKKAETPEGLQGIFRNSRELKNFVEDTLYDSQVLKDFKLYCRVDSLPLAKTLSEAIGTLDKYEADNEDMFWPDLSSYIGEQLDDFLVAEQRRKRQEKLQKRFSDFLLNFKCSKCDAPYHTMCILSFDNSVVCRCGESYKPQCLECGSRLVFDGNAKTFVCKQCGFVFKLPTVTVRYTFLREPADFKEDDSRKDTLS